MFGYISIGLLAIVIFNIGFNHIWMTLYISGHSQDIPSMELMEADLDHYQAIPEELLTRYQASIEVLDEDLRVIDSRGVNQRLGYQYSNTEFADIFMNQDPNQFMLSQRLIANDGSACTVVLRQQLSQPLYMAFQETARIYAITVIISSLVIMGVFLVLGVRAIYTPLQRELGVVDNSMAKVPYDPSPVDESQFSLTELRASIGTFNAMVGAMESMRKEKEELVDQNRRLVSNLSHDLKSPMTTLKGYAELLQQEELPPEEQKRYLSYIHSNVTALNSMVELLFEHVRYQHNDYALKLERRDMNGFLRDICANYYMVLDQLGFEIDIEIMEEPCYLDFDTVNMRRVYANLLENAISHNPEPTRLQIATYVDNGWYAAAIKDDGAGINEADRGKVFEPYYQGDISRTKQHSGLGLYAAKQIVEKHGGTIILTSEPAYKTVFMIHLPISDGTP